MFTLCLASSEMALVKPPYCPRQAMFTDYEADRRQSLFITESCDWMKPSSKETEARHGLECAPNARGGNSKTCPNSMGTIRVVRPKHNDTSPHEKFAAKPRNPPSPPPRGDVGRRGQEKQSNHLSWMTGSRLKTCRLKDPIRANREGSGNTRRAGVWFVPGGLAVCGERGARSQESDPTNEDVESDASQPRRQTALENLFGYRSQSLNVMGIFLRWMEGNGQGDPPGRPLARPPISVETNLLLAPPTPTPTPQEGKNAIEGRWQFRIAIYLALLVNRISNARTKCVRARA